MIYKGHAPKQVNSKSNFRRVLALIAQGQTDRILIAESLGISRREVRNAIWNLQRADLIEPVKHDWRKGHGRGETVYQVKINKPEPVGIFHCVSFIFNVGEQHGAS